MWVGAIDNFIHLIFENSVVELERRDRRWKDVLLDAGYENREARVCNSCFDEINLMELSKPTAIDTTAEDFE